MSNQGNEKFQSHAGACAFACAGGSAGAGSEMLVPAVLVLALVLMLVLVPLPVRVVLLVLVLEAMPCCCCLSPHVIPHPNYFYSPSSLGCYPHPQLCSLLLRGTATIGRLGYAHLRRISRRATPTLEELEALAQAQGARVETTVGS